MSVLPELELIDASCIRSADVDASRKYQDINDCLIRLNARKRDKVEAQHPYMPKVVWKLTCFQQGILFRAIALQNGISASINQNNSLCALLLCRALIEVAGSIWSVSRAVEKGIVANNLTAIDTVLMKSVFSTRWEKFPENYQATNILTLLDRLDDELMGGNEKPSRGNYELLSEFAHPNWSGTLGFFGDLRKADFTYTFSFRPVDDSINAFLISGNHALMIIEFILNKIDSFMPELLKMCPDEDTKRAE